LPSGERRKPFETSCDVICVKLGHQLSGGWAGRPPPEQRGENVAPASAHEHDCAGGTNAEACGDTGAPACDRVFQRDAGVAMSRKRG
jgi:hypothetical protein